MADPIVELGPAWALLVPAMLLVAAAGAAVLSGGLEARASGRPVASGLASPVFETARLLRQRRQFTVAADAPLWRIGGGGLLVAALLMVAVVPFGSWTVADLGVGVVWFTAIEVCVWAFTWLLGWGANSANALVGGYRFLGQALSYELPLMFVVITPATAASSLRMADVVEAQSVVWFVVWMPVAFLVFCAGVVAFSSWGPFGTAVGADLAGGVFADLTGVDRLVAVAGRYTLLAAGAAFAVALFLGGGAGPFLPAWLWSALKTLALLAVFVGVRRILPTIRPQRFAEVAWVIVMPLVLVQLLVVAIIVAGS